MPPRNPDPIGELFDRIRETLTDYAHDMIDDARRKLERPRAPRAKRVSGKAPKQPKAKPQRPVRPQLTLYSVLEVTRGASPAVIEAAYKALAKKHHPDHGGNPEAMKDITAAYSILKDPAKRREYDRSLR
jgi:DnaJ-class molecular chaperone